MNRVVITGATGFIGQPLCQYLQGLGFSVGVLTRDVQAAKELLGNKYTFCSITENPDVIANFINESTAVVNLAGEPLFGRRMTAAYWKKVFESRLQLTKTLVEAMGRCSQPPMAFISASAEGYYGYNKDTAIEKTEDSPAGPDDWGKMIAGWEGKAQEAQKLGIRTVILRTTFVLGMHGGGFARLMKPFRLYFGGPILPLGAWKSWVHIDDVVRAIGFMITNVNIHGAVNVTSPKPVTNRDFAKILATAMNKPCRIPVPSFILWLLFGKSSVALHAGKKIIPEKLLKAGFLFRFPVLKDAVDSLINKN